METQCPSCQTVFELSEDDLARADGKVRCGECSTVFDARSHLAPGAEDDSGHTETGVGWVLLPADQAVSPTDNEGAQYLTGAEDAAWQSVGAPHDKTASNTETDEPLRFDDNSPLPEDNARLAETLAHEPTPVVFKIVDNKSAADDEAAQPPDPPDTSAEPAPQTDDDTSERNGEPDDWAMLLAEIDDDVAVTEPTVGDNGETDTTDAEAIDSESPASDSKTEESVTDTPADADSAADAMAESATDNESASSESDSQTVESDTGAPAEADSAADVTAEVATDGDGDAIADLSAEAGQADENTDDAVAEAVDESAYDAEIDANLLSAYDSNESDAHDFLDDVLDELPDRDDLAPSDSAPTDETDSDSDSDSDDEVVDSSGIFVQETVLPDQEELTDVTPDAAVEASIVEAIDNEHFSATDTSTMDDSDSPEWLDEPVPTVPATRRQKLLVAGLALLAVVQFAHFERRSLATYAPLHPMYQKIYGAELHPAWDVTAMCFEQWDALAGSEQMRIVGRIANRGSRAQPYPLLHVELLGRFDNGNGDQTLGHALLTPNDYLRDARAEDWVGPNVRFDAEAEFADDQQQTSGYELELCYRGPDDTLLCNGPCPN